MKLIPTKEQELIVETASEGKSIAITAYAGAAKTSTCLMIAAKVRKHSLYVAYNKAIATEATSKFPMWVEPRTVHSLAWHSVVKGSNYGAKLSGFIDKSKMSEAVPELMSFDYPERVELQAEILSLISEFCISDSFSIADFVTNYATSGKVVELTVEFWESMINKNSDTQITHDTYLKLFQLSRPDLGYKLIYADEFQDCNPVILDIILRQNCQKIVVGDRFQAIYAWLGAIDAFEAVTDDFVNLELTTSFRFGANIADKANRVLDILGATSQVVGAGKATTVESKAILVRTNLDLFNFLVGYAQQGKRVQVIGDLKDLFTKLYSAKNLQCKGDRAKRYDRQIATYDSWKTLCDDVPANPDLGKVVSIVSKYKNIHEAITMVKSCLCYEGESPDVVLVTAHKSKGLEWDSVELATGFVPEGFNVFDRETQKEILLENQVGNLLYVALTRAKIELIVPNELVGLLK